MGDKPTFWLPEQASTLAPELDALFYFVYGVSSIIFFAVVGAIVYFAYTYRRRREDEIPEVVEESRILEAAWIIVPTILTLIVFTWGFQGFVRLNVAPPDAYEIRARAASWLWEFEYPNGFKSAGELHVPVDRPVRVVISSDDVLHSFAVPAFRVKQDVLPDRYTSVWFQATAVGEYDIYCTEYCGTGHSGMLGKVIVDSEADFREFVESGGIGDLTPVELGERLYNQLNCYACHSVDGTPGVGPSLKGLSGQARQFTDGTSATADENYLREAIVAPAAKIVQGYVPAMPATYTTLEAVQLDALIAYINSLAE